ncbi:hypothetical protein UlMin_010842 [Ulmus minor]
MTMGKSDVCPTEDTLQILLEVLLDPLLPSISSLRIAPSQSQEQKVAKQVHAIVLLYNYYHRKQCPEVEFLAFDSFCKLAGILRPALHGYLRYFQRSNKMELIDVEEQVSITEKAIMDACDISKTLDASKEVPYFEEWPSTKVTVLLVDSRIENCLLQFGSITQGIWSVIEKDVEILHQNLGTTETKRKDKKQRVIQKQRVQSKNGSVDFLQLAYMAVKEATDISQNELVVLENHVVYSLSKEKTAARFYIMQCTQSGYEKVISFPLKDAIQRLQGPLIEKTSGQWTYNPVLEYFHVLPYAQILSDWLSREVVSNGLQNSMLREKPWRVETSCEEAMDDTSESSLADGVGEDLELLEKKETIGRDLNGLASGLNMKFKLMESTKQSLNASFSAEKAANGNKISENLTSHQNETGGLSLAAHQPNSRSLEKLQSTLAAKGNLLSETALKVLIKKRDKLCLQMRNLGDEIAECERKMMTIANGGEDDLTVKIETIIEGCNDVIQGSSRGNTQLLGEQCSSQYNKRKILPEAVLNIQNPCQELDGVCYANNWILPTYRVYPTEGGFKANVSIRGVDFDYTIEGELQSNPHEARDSAAAGILVKLRAITAKV